MSRRNCTATSVTLPDATGTFRKFRWDQVRVYGTAADGTVRRIRHWRDVARLEADAEAAGGTWNGVLYAATGATLTAEAVHAHLTDGAALPPGAWPAASNSQSVRARRTPERLALIRDLATLAPYERSGVQLNRRVSDATSRCVDWLHSTLATRSVSDVEIIERLGWEVKVDTVDAELDRVGVRLTAPNSSAAPDPRRRALAERVVALGLDMTTVAELATVQKARADVISLMGRFTERCEEGGPLAGTALAAAVAAHTRLTPHQQRLRPDLTYLVLLEAAAVAAQDPSLAVLPTATAISLLALDVSPGDVDPDGSWDTRIWDQVASWGARVPAEAVITAARDLDGDPVRLHLACQALGFRGQADTDALEAKVTELQELRRLDAVLSCGTVADVAWAHLFAQGLSRDEAVHVAAAFTDRHELSAAGNPDLVTKVRALPAGAFAKALAAAQADHDLRFSGHDLSKTEGSDILVVDELGYRHRLTPSPVGRRREHHDSALDSATRLALCFNKQWQRYLQAGEQAAKAAGRSSISIHELTYWLPMNEASKDFGDWLIQSRRVQAIFTGEKGEIGLRRIGEEFGDLSDEDRRTPVNQLISRLRARGYGKLGELPYGQLAAEIDVPVSRATETATRWVRALHQPSPFPLTKVWTDDTTGLKGYFLPRHDPRGLWLGHLTDCCQYPGSAGQACAWAGHENPGMGFFIVEDRNGTVVAQSWTWADGKGGVCFDNVERKTSTADGWNAHWDGGDGANASAAMAGLDWDSMNATERRSWAIRGLYHQASDGLLDRFDYVTMGTSMTKIPLKGVPAAAGDTLANPDAMGYSGYRDSQRQALFARRPRKTGAVVTAIPDRPAGEGFRVTWRNKKGEPRFAVDIVGDQATVHLGDLDSDARNDALTLMAQRLADMGPRTWKVTDSDGNPLTPPAADTDDDPATKDESDGQDPGKDEAPLVEVGDDGTWELRGPSRLALADMAAYEEALQVDLTQPYDTTGWHDWELRRLSSHGLSPADPIVNALHTSPANVTVDGIATIVSRHGEVLRPLLDGEDRVRPEALVAATNLTNTLDQDTMVVRVRQLDARLTAHPDADLMVLATLHDVSDEDLGRGLELARIVRAHEVSQLVDDEDLADDLDALVAALAATEGIRPAPMLAANVRESIELARRLAGAGDPSDDEPASEETGEAAEASEPGTLAGIGAGDTPPPTPLTDINEVFATAATIMAARGAGLTAAVKAVHAGVRSAADIIEHPNTAFAIALAASGVTPARVKGLPKRFWAATGSRSLPEPDDVVDLINACEAADVPLTSLTRLHPTWTTKKAAAVIAAGTDPRQLPKQLPADASDELIEAVTGMDLDLRDYERRDCNDTDMLLRYSRYAKERHGNHWWREGTEYRDGTVAAACMASAMLAAEGITPAVANAYPHTWGAEDVIAAHRAGLSPDVVANSRPNEVEALIAAATDGVDLTKAADLAAKAEVPPTAAVAATAVFDDDRLELGAKALWAIAGRLLSAGDDQKALRKAAEKLADADTTTLEKVLTMSDQRKWSSELHDLKPEDVAEVALMAAELDVDDLRRTIGAFQSWVRRQRYSDVWGENSARTLSACRTMIELRARLGYAPSYGHYSSLPLGPKTVTKLVDAGVTPAAVRAWQEEGFHLSEKELRAIARQKVTAASLVEAMTDRRTFGRRTAEILTAEDPDAFAAAVDAVGEDRAVELVRRHGPERVADWARVEARFGAGPVTDLLRRHNVPVKEAEAMADLLKLSSAESLTRLCDRLYSRSRARAFPTKGRTTEVFGIRAKLSVTKALSLTAKLDGPALEHLGGVGGAAVAEELGCNLSAVEGTSWVLRHLTDEPTVEQRIVAAKAITVARDGARRLSDRSKAMREIVTAGALDTDVATRALLLEADGVDEVTALELADTFSAAELVRDEVRKRAAKAPAKVREVIKKLRKAAPALHLDVDALAALDDKKVAQAVNEAATWAARARVDLGQVTDPKALAALAAHPDRDQVAATWAGSGVPCDEWVKLHDADIAPTRVRRWRTLRDFSTAELLRLERAGCDLEQTVALVRRDPKVTVSDIVRSTADPGEVEDRSDGVIVNGLTRRGVDAAVAASIAQRAVRARPASLAAFGARIRAFEKKGLDALAAATFDCSARDAAQLTEIGVDADTYAAFAEKMAADPVTSRWTPKERAAQVRRWVAAGVSANGVSEHVSGARHKAACLR